MVAIATVLGLVSAAVAGEERTHAVSAAGSSAVATTPLENLRTVARLPKVLRMTVIMTGPMASTS